MNEPKSTKPTTERLQEIYTKEIQHRPHWPRTFEAAMNSALISRVLALLATHPPDRHRPVEHRHSRCKAQPEIEAVDDNPQMQRQTTRKAFVGLDRKSLAAGEKPDDD